MPDLRRFAPATARNRDPILEVLRRHVAPGARVLEIASGSGEHAIDLAPALAVASWQPTDRDPDARASIDAWREHAGPAAAVVLPATELDVLRWRPAEAAFDVVVCINMIHIAPVEAALAALEGAAQALRPGGVLYLYGPYRRDGRHTAASNEAFDASLRARDPSWGVRDLEWVTSSAASHGLELVEVTPMPANNLSVVLRRGARPEP
jgi:SAM-dependent methyltransferase